MTRPSDYLASLDSGHAPITKETAEKALIGAAKACRLVGDDKAIAAKRMRVWWDRYGKGGALTPTLSLAIEEAYRKEPKSYDDSATRATNTRERDWLLESVLVSRRDGGEESRFWWNEAKAEQRKISAANVGLLLGEEADAFMAARSMVCSFVFDPHAKKITDDGTQSFYNTYEPPNWLRDYYFHGTPPNRTECPEIVLRFLGYLYDDDAESIAYDLDWMAASLKGRTMCALGNVGECEGSGKGTNAELKARLHGVFGKTDWAVKSDVFSSKFNRFMSKKTFCCIQEIKIENDSQMNRFKELFDDEIAIEGKGEDARTERNHCSIMFTSNNLDCLTLPSGQRRFSLLNVSGTKLTERMNGKELDAFREELLSEKTISALGRYLWQTHIIRRDLKLPFVGVRSEEIRLATLKEWEQSILDWAVENPGMSIPVEQLVVIPEVAALAVKPGRTKLEALGKRFPDYIKVPKNRNERRKVESVWRAPGEKTENVGTRSENPKIPHQDAEFSAPGGDGDALGTSGDMGTDWGHLANTPQDSEEWEAMKVDGRANVALFRNDANKKNVQLLKSWDQ